MTALTFETLAHWMNVGIAVDFSELGFEVEAIEITA